MVLINHYFDFLFPQTTVQAFLVLLYKLGLFDLTFGLTP